MSEMDNVSAMNGGSSIKHVVAIILSTALCMLSACSSELPILQPDSRIQLTHEVVLQAALSDDNKHVFLLTQGPVFSQWDIATSNVVSSITPRELSPNTRKFALSSDESHLLTSDGKSVLLWLLKDAEMRKPKLLGGLDFQQHLGDANISAMAFINDLEFVTGNTDGSFIFADVQNQLFRRSQFHSNEVTKFLIDSNKTRLYSAGNDGRVLVTDLQTYEKKTEYHAPFRITSLVSNHANSALFLSDALYKQVIWRPGQNRVITQLDYFERFRFFRLGLFLENDTKLLTTSPKTEVSLWDTQSGAEIARWQATAQSLGTAIVDLALHREGQLITITSDSVVETWDLDGVLN